MNESIRTIVKCEDPGDDSGDVIIELPPGVLAQLDVGIGDSLSIDLTDEAILLKPIRHAETKSNDSR